MHLYSVGIGVVSRALRFGCAACGRGSQASARKRRARSRRPVAACGGGCSNVRPPTTGVPLQRTLGSDLGEVFRIYRRPRLGGVWPQGRSGNPGRDGYCGCATCWSDTLLALSTPKSRGYVGRGHWGQPPALVCLMGRGGGHTSRSRDRSKEGLSATRCIRLRSAWPSNHLVWCLYGRRVHRQRLALSRTAS